MIYCAACVPEGTEVCDFCKYYDFNGDEEGAYTGDGFCRLRSEKREPYDCCESFHCRSAEAA